MSVLQNACDITTKRGASTFLQVRHQRSDAGLTTVTRSYRARGKLAERLAGVFKRLDVGQDRIVRHCVQRQRQHVRSPADTST